MLYLYEPADPISAMWAKSSSVERPKFVWSRSEAMAVLPKREHLASLIL